MRAICKPHIPFQRLVSQRGRQMKNTSLLIAAASIILFGSSSSWAGERSVQKTNRSGATVTSNSKSENGQFHASRAKTSQNGRTRSTESKGSFDQSGWSGVGTSVSSTGRSASISSTGSRIDNTLNVKNSVISNEGKVWSSESVITHDEGQNSLTKQKVVTNPQGNQKSTVRTRVRSSK
jgi:hypothetical protein